MPRKKVTLADPEYIRSWSSPGPHGAKVKAALEFLRRVLPKKKYWRLLTKKPAWVVDLWLVAAMIDLTPTKRLGRLCAPLPENYDEDERWGPWVAPDPDSVLRRRARAPRWASPAVSHHRAFPAWVYQGD